MAEQHQKLMKRLIGNPIAQMFEARAGLRCLPEKSKPSGSISVIQLQTGAGKTHNGMGWTVLQACRAALENINGEHHDSVIYLTPNVHNVRGEFEKAMSLIQSLKDEGLLSEEDADQVRQKFIVVPSSADCTVAMLRGHTERVSFVSQLNALFPELRSASHKFSGDFDELLRRCFAAREAQGDLKAILQEDQRKLRNLVLRAIEGQYRSLPEIMKDPKKAEWLRMVAPDRLVGARVCEFAFMTVTRAIYPISAWGTNVPPIDILVDATGNASARRKAIIIDEVDSAKRYMQKAIFDTDNKEVDLAGVIVQLARARDRRRWHRYEDAPELTEMIGKLLNACAVFCDEHHLDGDIQICGDLEAVIRGNSIVFAGDRSFFYTSGQDFSACYDLVPSGINLHRAHNAENETSLMRLIFEIEGFFDFNVVPQIANILTKMQDCDLQESIARRRMHFETPKSTLLEMLLSHLGMATNSEGTTNPRVARYIERKIGFRRSGKHKMISNVYETGVKSDRVTPAARHPKSNCQILVTSIDRTPEGILIEAAQHNDVIGVSATATARSVVHNFNHDYLSSKLGDRYIEMSPAERRAARDTYEAERQYAKAVLEGRLCFDMGHKQARGDVRKIVLEGRFLKGALRTEYKAYLKNEEKRFDLQRFLDFAAAVDAFLDDGGDAETGGRVLLSFLNRSASKNIRDTKILLDDVLRGIVSEVGKIHGKTPVVLHGYSSDLRAGGLKDMAPSHDAPVVILSTWRSMASGFNPQRVFQKGEKKSAVLVGVDRGEATIDIDGLFMEMPRNAFELAVAKIGQKLSAIYDIETLLLAGHISPVQAGQYRREILMANFLEEDEDGNDPVTSNILSGYKKSDDFRDAIFAMVEQAVGRLTRTPWRRPKLRYYVCGELRAHLARDRFLSGHPDLKSYEYKALVEAVQKGLPLAEVSSNAENESRNRGAHVHGAAIIHKTMDQFRSPDEAKMLEGIRRWEMLRNYVMTHPTLDLKNDWSRIYFAFVNPASAYEIWHNRQDFTTERSEISSTLTEGWDRFHISAISSGLSTFMKNDAARKHFKAKGFAVDFKPASFMLSPVLMQATYMPAISEEVFRALVEYQGLECARLDPEHFELFDILVGPARMPVDVKHYSPITAARTDIAELTRKTGYKLRRMGRKRGLVVQSIGSDRDTIERVQWHHEGGAEVGYVPGLLDRDGQLIEKNMTALIRALADGV